jgi:mannobiose 2-epimerase
MLRSCLLLIALAAYIPVCGQNEPPPPPPTERQAIKMAMEAVIKKDMLSKWYPQSMDKQYGGFLSTFTYDFKPTGEQDKMIVTQSRHTWTNAKAALRYPDVAHYKEGARHGFEFLRDVMWDKTYGGFYQLVDRQGKVKGGDQKTAYGNAFGLYALAAYYKQSRDTAALRLAKESFLWLEKHSHDPVLKGYFQHLMRDGTPVKRTASTPSASDIGYKDQNSSIHLLEAFTELYGAWPDGQVRERIKELLLLIRDKIVTKKGYMVLFFQPDWAPVSFADSSEAVILQRRYLDHVSFGHDVETAYLLLEAAHTILLDDPKTMVVAKRMVDHALQNGWDDTLGGFYDEGYYFKGKRSITIIRQTKNWWAQAEALNTLELMSEQFPYDKAQYFEKFKKQWKYVNTYLVDHEHGDWYEEGLDKSPQRKTALKGHIWKAMYHQYRALTTYIDRIDKYK